MATISFVSSITITRLFSCRSAYRPSCSNICRLQSSSAEKLPIPQSKPQSPSSSPSASTNSNFEILSETVLFKRYQTVYKRDIRYPNGRVVSFDVLGNERSEFQSVFVFPFNTATRTATLIREYSPGRNAEQLSLVAGMFESTKHPSLDHAARAELSEEAHLSHGTLMPLSSSGFAADKYSMNTFFYYLALDCQQDLQPGPRDEEEWIHVVPGVPLSEVRKSITDGLFNVPHSLCALLALDKLRDMGYDS